MIEINEKYMKRCYELAINAGKKGFDTFGAVLVCDGEILEEAENTADFEKKIFGHAEFNLVHKCANKLLPFDYQAVDREGLLKQLGIDLTLTESVLEDEGMHVFEWWGGEYRPLDELIAEMDEVKQKSK